jgi:cyclase
VSDILDLEVSDYIVELSDLAIGRFSDCRHFFLQSPDRSVTRSFNFSTMFAKRIIPCLDCKDGRVVKGVQFVDLRDAGDPGKLAEIYNHEGADELVMLDISASQEGRATLMDTVNRVASRLFIPLTVGGGVRTLEDAQRLLSAGADKVAVNTAAVETPDLISEIAAQFGSQAVVVAIDAKLSRDATVEDQPSLSGGAVVSRLVREPDGRMRQSWAYPRVTVRRRPGTSPWDVVTYGGTHQTEFRALEWAARAESLGAGEILLTSMDADGTQRGFDCELTAAISKAVHIPVIASGGAGGLEHFAEVFQRGAADAALAASIFHFGQHSIRSLKEYLMAQGVPVRLSKAVENPKLNG